MTSGRVVGPRAGLRQWTRGIFARVREHAVLIHADPAGQHAAVGTLSPSDCFPAGPAGP